MHRFRLFIRALGAAAVAALFATTLTAHAAAPVTYSVKPGIDKANLDPTCKACDDFFRFATGGWEKAHPIPAAYANWGTFNVLFDDNTNVLHDILEGAAKNTNAAAGSNEQKIGTYYRACMDEPAVEAAGIVPLHSILAGIANVDTPTALVLETAVLSKYGIGAGLELGIRPDQKNSGEQLPQLLAAGLGLPDRDYYLKDDERFVKVRAAYTTYMTTIFTNLGEAPATAQSDAANVLVLETAMAKVRPDRSELRDPAKTYHPTSVAELQTQIPVVDWNGFFAATGAPRFATVNVTLPETIKAVAGLYTTTPLDTWKAYERVRTIDAYAAALPKSYVDAAFAFRGTALSGTTAQLPRWKRCAAAVNGALGEALGAVYVEQTFPPAAKARALALVDNLQSVLGDDIKTLDWMSAATKVRALAKLNAFTKKIGYPDTFRDYSKLAVKNDSFLANSIRVQSFENAREIARFGKPTNRTEWGMTPPTVNAYYNPPNNEIVFPAGILHPPFFSEQNDDAVNYGAIGAVIGHEMTHGFDDQGRKYDEHGNTSDWWTPQDATNFNKRAQCIVDEFNGFEVAPGVHEKGVNVQGEAIADLGGITIAYKAFERTPEAKAHKMIDGYTPEQRFFLAYAQVWAGHSRQAAAETQATSDPHPAGKFRVIGTLSNMPEFRKAFGCVAGDKMVRANSCQIW